MKKYQVNVHYDAVVTVCGILANSEEEALEIAKKRAETMSLNEAEVVDENSCVTLTEDATPEETAAEVATRLENGDFELVEDDNYPQTDNRTVTVPVSTGDSQSDRHMLDIEVDVDGKAYNTRTTDGPRGRTLYCERGFTCKKITPVSLKVDGVQISPLSDALKKSLQDILDDTDAIEDFNSSQMY